MFRLSVRCSHCAKEFLGSITPSLSEISCLHCNLPFPFPTAGPAEPLWLVAKGSQKAGPFSRAQLTELACSGQLARADRVLLQGTKDWQDAQAIPGLFPSIHAEPGPRLVADSAGLDADDDHIFSAHNSPTPQGPLSLRGIKVQPHFSLTLGDFQILRKLGAGGMGAVYLATQRSRDRSVALKVLSETLAGSDTFVSRFLREIEILARLDHPHIVKFLGAGQEKGIPFLAMEFIEGFSTASLVKHLGKLAVGDALYIVRQTIEALNYAGAHKIVHRDIKPENIMITRFGQTKITDLGLAKPLEEPELNLTDTGSVLGSPKYMAPEQSRNAKHADHRSDIYALGGVLYYLLTAQEPFQGATAVELLEAKEKKSITPARRLNPDVPSRLGLILDKMLAKDLKYRYQNYGDLIRDLDSLGLTHAQLSFDPTHAVPGGQLAPIYDLVEILLIDDDFDDVRLARQALAERRIPSNLVVVKDGAEARAFLRREGKFLLAPPPNLIIFGSNLSLADSLMTLEEIKLSDALSKIPLIMLSSSADTSPFFESRGYHVNLVANVPNDPNQFNDLFKSVQGLCLTVMELKVTS
jgi:serine/threonine protein kinase